MTMGEGACCRRQVSPRPTRALTTRSMAGTWGWVPATHIRPPPTVDAGGPRVDHVPAYLLDTADSATPKPRHLTSTDHRMSCSLPRGHSGSPATQTRASWLARR